MTYILGCFVSGRMRLFPVAKRQKFSFFISDSDTARQRHYLHYLHEKKRNNTFALWLSRHAICSTCANCV